MAEDVVIGRIAVKVMPDTDDFRDEAKQKLRDIERSLKDVKVELKLDENKIVERARKLNAQVDRALKDQSIRVNFDNERSLTAAISRVDRELERLGETKVPLEVDEDGLSRQLDGFKADLKRISKIDVEFNPSSITSMERAIGKIDKELDKVRSITIDPNVNEADLLAARELIEEELGKAVTLKVETDDAAYDKIRQQIDDVFDDLIIDPDLDPSKVNRKLREIEKLIEQISDKEIELEAALNQRDKRAIERDIEDLQDKLDKLKGEVEIDISEPGKAHAMASLAVLTRDRIVHLIPIVSKTAAANAATALAALSGARLAGDILDKLWNSVKNLDKAAPIIGTLALAIANLGAVGIAAAAELASLSASLASIAPAALALPGIFGGLVIGLGATIVAFQDFNNRLPEVGKALTVLKGQMQDNFWSAAQQPIQTLVDTLLPQFSAGINKVSGELGGFFATLATGLTGSFDGALAGMFDDLSASIRIASGATDALANIITVLGQVGAGYLPRLAQWFVDITEKFSAFLTTSQGNGDLTRWIDQGIAALIAFGLVIANTAKILYGLGTAAQAAGGSTLSTLADGLGNIAAVVNSPDFQTGLTSVFTSAYEAMNNIATIAGPAVEHFFGTLPGLLAAILPVAGAALGTLVSGLATLLAQPALQGGLVALFNGIKAAVDALSPAFAPVGTAIGALANILGTFIASVGPALATLFVGLAQAVTTILPALQPLVTLLGTALLGALSAIMPAVQVVAQAFAAFASSSFGPLQTALTAIVPVLSQVANVLGSVLATALSAVAPVLAALAQHFASMVPVIGQLFAVLGPVVNQILAALGPVLAQIIGALSPLVQMLAHLVLSILTPLLQVVGEVVSAALPPLGDAIARVAAALEPFITALQAVVDFLMPILAPAIKFVAELLLDSLIAAINGVALVFEGVVDIVMGLWNTFAGLFTGDWGRMWNGIKQVFGGVWDTIKGLFDVVLNVGILGIAGKGLAALKAAFTGGWAAIKSLWKVAVDGIKGLFDNWWTGLKSAASGGINTIKSTLSAGWNAVKSTASTVWSAIVSTVKDKINDVIVGVKILPGQIKDAFSGAASWLISAGRQIIQGLINGIKAMFGSVKSALGDLTSKLTSWKGPAATDRTLLTPAGVLIMDGFIAGLESRYDVVRKSLSGLTRDIGDMTVRAPRISAAAAGVTASVTGALDNGTTGAGTQKILNYYAAPGSSIDSEEDLFAASSRARMVGW